MGVIPVEIVRPKKSTTERWSLSLAKVAVMFLQAWILMLILGTLTDFGVGYWHTILLMIGYRSLQPMSSYLEWTKASK